jgi:hypothetical protein
MFSLIRSFFFKPHEDVETSPPPPRERVMSMAMDEEEDGWLIDAPIKPSSPVGQTNSSESDEDGPVFMMDEKVLRMDNYKRKRSKKRRNHRRNH